LRRKISKASCRRQGLHTKDPAAAGHQWVGGRASLAQWLLIRTTADCEWLRPASWAVDGLQDDFTPQQIRGRETWGFSAKPSTPEAKKKDGGGREEKREILYSRSTPDQEQQRWTWPSRKWQREGRAHRCKLANDPHRLFLPPSSEPSAATPQNVQSDSRASGFIASGSRGTIGEGPFLPPTQ
jgi:hypothetical protein